MKLTIYCLPRKVVYGLQMILLRKLGLLLLTEGIGKGPLSQKPLSSARDLPIPEVPTSAIEAKLIDILLVVLMVSC